ncbi:MAG TPA: hypothetical protein DCM38_12780 [Gammaproteobacteria bacterium]|nr:hypothetical protein [Gammaproteobacteria bacterium]
MVDFKNSLPAPYKTHWDNLFFWICLKAFLGWVCQKNSLKKGYQNSRNSLKLLLPPKFIYSTLMQNNRNENGPL